MAAALAVAVQVDLTPVMVEVMVAMALATVVHRVVAVVLVDIVVTVDTEKVPVGTNLVRCSVLPVMGEEEAVVVITKWVNMVQMQAVVVAV
jgi:hypothetical protein